MKSKENNIDNKLITGSGSSVSISRSCVSSKESCRSSSSRSTVKITTSSSSLSASIFYSISLLSINECNQSNFEKVKTFSVIKKSAYDKPYIYAYDVIQNCGIKKPPVPTELVLEYHGLKLKEFSYSESPFPSLDHDIGMRNCSWLNWERKTIYVHKNLSYGKKRNRIFHECAHNHIPWHRGINYFSCENDLFDNRIKAFENEAFQYAAELIIPRIFLFNDFDSNISYSKIREIQNKYKTSFEMSAIRFIKFNPSKCCFVVAALSNISSYSLSNFNSYSPATIQYCAYSKDFPAKFRRGCHIENRSAAHRACFRSLVNNSRYQSPVFLTNFGSSNFIEANAEFMPLPNSSSVFILLWIPDEIYSDAPF